MSTLLNAVSMVMGVVATALAVATGAEGLSWTRLPPSAPGRLGGLRNGRGALRGAAIPFLAPAGSQGQVSWPISMPALGYQRRSGSLARPASRTR